MVRLLCLAALATLAAAVDPGAHPPLLLWRLSISSALLSLYRLRSIDESQLTRVRAQTARRK